MLRPSAPAAPGRRPTAGRTTRQPSRRPSWAPGRLAGAAAVALIVALAGCGGEPDAAPVQGIAGPSPAGPAQGSEEVIVAEAVVAEVVAYTGPSSTSPELARLSHPTINGGPLVFQVLTRGDEWLEVLLPVRPNGSVGWIRTDTVTLSRNPYRIEVDTSDHRLTVLEAGQPVETATVAIGTGDTPTPLGSFYLTELLAPPDPAGPYGPFAFGLSGYSETLHTFNGGDAIIGIHGTDEPAALGTDVSHGCIRVANEVITDLASYLPLGTPVVITP